jgi:AraC family transcriptional regulator
MSLQTSYEQSTTDHVVDLRSIDLVRSDHGETEKSRAKRRVAKDSMLSLRHLDIAVAITADDGDAERSPEGASCFKVSAKRLIGCSEDSGQPSADRDDPVIRRLAEALAATEAAHDRHSAVCADALRLAILTRQFSAQVVPDRSRIEQPSGRNARSLQKWRLKRVLQYVDDHLAAKLSLQDLATVAGLSRMHFAAQFRAAMGLGPHQYLLKRRIERAEELLKRAEVSLVDVAFTVGFQTQAHFTTVFKRFAGDTPYQWRSAYLAQCVATPPVHARLS